MGNPSLARPPCPRNLTGKRNDVPGNPLAKQSKAELAVLQRCDHELEGSFARRVQIESVYEQKRVRGREAHTFVAVEEGMIVDQRLKQRRRLFAQFVVVTSLRTEHRSLQRSLIAQPVRA